MFDTKLKILITISGLVLSTLPSTSAAVANGQRLNVTNTRGLNMRAGAGADTISLDILDRTATVTATGVERGGWLQVDAGGVLGWVNARYVTEAGYCATCQTPSTGGRLLNAGRAVVRAVYNKVLSCADRISRYFWVGHRVGDSKCWRAVWEVLKRAKLVSGELTQRYAKNAYKDLQKFGFRHDPSACKTPGVVRVYDSARPGYGINTAGDYAGHIEIMGNDRRFHHSKSTAGPMNERVGNASRPLKYCLIKSTAA